MAAIFAPFFLILSVFSSLASISAQLSPAFHDGSCPHLQSIVRDAMKQAVDEDQQRVPALLHLHYQDCILNGCDASNLLDDNAIFAGEKNSVRGFDVIDTIKAKVEADCPGMVSCADILALAARDAVVLLGGPSWPVNLGRRDARTADQSAANDQIPSPSSKLGTLISIFAAKGLSARDMTALFGAHTIGQAQCQFFRTRIYNETNIDPNFATLRMAGCPSSGGDTNLAPLDRISPLRFDNNFFSNLVAGRGLLHSDQELFNGGSLDDLVRMYSTSSAAFFSDFAAAMVKMGDINPLTGTSGEIRKTCRAVN